MKTKRPYETALAAALEVVDLLRPTCERIELAGSLRRECREVGDIEVVAIPRRTLNLLGELDGLELDSLLGREPRTLLGKDGPKYKQFEWLGVDYPCQVDLFLADAANWGYILALRTGPADYSRRLVTPTPYGLKPPHIRVAGGYVYSCPASERLSLPEETELYAAWGLPYAEPKERK